MIKAINQHNDCGHDEQWVILRCTLKVGARWALLWNVEDKKGGKQE